jgi:Uma2 family endonuclease
MSVKGVANPAAKSSSSPEAPLRILRFGPVKFRRERMATEKPRILLRLDYADAAQTYLRSLPREHFMEATPQATQREITVESLALLKAQRPDVQYFNELLVQYPHGRQHKIRQVVPDNMVVVHPEPIDAEDSYDVLFQPVRPFWVLEYLSPNSRRKDYDDSFRRYERELKVPYYLLSYPDPHDLTLFRHTGRKYVMVRANAAGRLAITRLDLEMALLDGWVRFWFKGKLLPLPAELQRQLQEAEQRAGQAEERARQAEEQARRAQEQADQERREKEKLLAQLRERGIEPQP